MKEVWVCYQDVGSPDGTHQRIVKIVATQEEADTWLKEQRTSLEYYWAMWRIGDTAPTYENWNEGLGGLGRNLDTLHRLGLL